MTAEQLAASYRAWLAAGAQKVGPDPFELRDASWECPHGRLPHDAWRSDECRCWQAPLKIRYPKRRKPPRPYDRWWISTGHRAGEHPSLPFWKWQYVRGGDSVETIAARFGCSPNTVLRQLRAAGVTIRPASRPPRLEIEQPIVEGLLKRGKTMDEIAVTLGVSRRSLFRARAAWRNQPEVEVIAA